MKPYTRKDAAEALNVTVRTVDHWLRCGVLSALTPADYGSVGSQTRVLIPAVQVAEVKAARERLQLKSYRKEA